MAIAYRDQGEHVQLFLKIHATIRRFQIHNTFIQAFYLNFQKEINDYWNE